MFAVAGGPSFAGSPLSGLFFARQPEPDLEFTEEELEQTTNVRSTSPMKSPKKSGGGRPILWLLLLALVGGGAYVAMEPEMVMDWINQLLGEPPAQQAPPPMAMRPAPAAPAAQPAPPAAESAAPAMPQTPPAAVAPPAPAPVPGPAATAPAPAPPMPAAPAAMPKAPATVAPPVSATPGPMFGEGQRVTVVLDPTLAGEAVTLSQDSTGTKPGPAVRTGTVLTILDGDLQANGWVYSVRTDDGLKGWVAEKRLRLKP